MPTPLEVGECLNVVWSFLGQGPGYVCAFYAFALRLIFHRGWLVWRLRPFLQKDADTSEPLWNLSPGRALVRLSQSAGGV